MRSDIKFPAMIILGFIVAVVYAQEPPTPKETTPPQTPKPAAGPKVTPRNVRSNDYIVEQLGQLRGAIKDLQEAYTQQLRKAALLATEVKQLRTANENFKRDLTLKFASNRDIDELAKKLVELDNNRRNDLDVTNKQIDEILKIVTKLAVAPVQPRNNGAGIDPAPANFKFRQHAVQPGEFLSNIQAAYNKAFKDEGLNGQITQSQILKANPGLKANRLFAGQKLRIPEPGEIK